METNRQIITDMGILADAAYDDLIVSSNENYFVNVDREGNPFFDASTSHEVKDAIHHSTGLDAYLLQEVGSTKYVIAFRVNLGSAHESTLLR
jgi:hypothetical protein